MSKHMRLFDIVIKEREGSCRQFYIILEQEKYQVGEERRESQGMQEPTNCQELELS